MSLDAPGLLHTELTSHARFDHDVRVFGSYERSVNCKHACDISCVTLSVLLHVACDRETSTKYFQVGKA